MEPYDTFDYGYVDTTAQSGGGFSGAVSDFFDAARAKITTVLAPATASSPQSPSIGSQLFEAIYQYGAGRIDSAREKAVNAFLMTSEGQKLQAEGVRQTTKQYWPMIAVGAVLLLLAGFALRR